MRRTLLPALAGISMLAFCTSSFAYPDEERRTPAFTLDWEARPTGRDFERHYPHRAAEARQSGVAILCCPVNLDGTLDCVSAYESAEGVGFGDAAVAISRAFRMRASDAQSWASSGERLRVPIWFLMNTSSSDPHVQAAQAEVFQATQSICDAHSAE